MSTEAVEYFREQLVGIVKKKGWTAHAIEGAVGMAMLQYAPTEIEGITGFQVYFRGKK
jgi:hypothetical protein